MSCHVMAAGRFAAGAPLEDSPAAGRRRRSEKDRPRLLSNPARPLWGHTSALRLHRHIVTIALLPDGRDGVKDIRHDNGDRPHRATVANLEASQRFFTAWPATCPPPHAAVS